jgi:hypothetical protein
MRSLRGRRLLILVTAVVAATALTGAVASATCGGGGGGEGATYALDVTPSTWDGFYTQEKTFTVKNIGQDAITELVISLLGSGLKITNNTCGKTLAVGAACNVTVECLKQDEDVPLSAIQYSPLVADTAILHCTVG